jgi:putative tricarboxylic transport membrane protein
MLEIFSYLVDSLSPFNLLLALGGVIAGTIIGAMPGLSATMAVAVLVPFTYVMGPASGLIVLGAIYTGAIFGGSISAILVNTPGTPSAIATTFDGYPMAKRGDGALAVTLSSVASVIGGLVGAIGLLLLAPPLAKVALAFGPAEYFWMAVFGLTLIASLSVGNTLKGLIGACIGLLLSVVGVAVVGGDVRYTFDSVAMLGGIDVTSAIIGLYCVPVIIDLVASKTPHLNFSAVKSRSYLKEACGLAWKEKLNLFRSSTIGTVVGVLPGAGGSIAGLVAYTEARRTAKEPETYGNGAPGGVMATESANNATVGGGFIPTLVLGIPGTPPDAIILGALLVQGIKTGPTLFADQGGIVYTFIFGLLIATVLMLPAGLILGRYAYKSIAKTPKALLVPTVAFLTMIGSFAIHSNPHDTIVMFVLGTLAWFLAKAGFSASPIVLGLVLGKIAEQGFVQTYLIGNAQDATMSMFFGRPISIGIIAGCVLAFSYPYIAAYRAKKRAQRLAEQAAPSTPSAVAPVKPQSLASMAVAVVLVATGGYLYAETDTMSALGAVFPASISIALMAFSAILIIQEVKRPWQTPSMTAFLEQMPSARQWCVIGILGFWTMAMTSLGFFTTAIIAFIALMFAASFEIPKWQRLSVHTVASVLIVTGFFLLMKNVLMLRMPTGWLF